MNIQSHIMRFRANQRKNDRSKPLGLIGLLIAVFLSLAAVIGVIYGVNRYAVLTENLPSADLVASMLTPPDGSLLEPTRIYDKDGRIVLWRFENPVVNYRHYSSITDGTMLFYSNVPEMTISAILTAFDPDYFQRPEGLLAGIWKNQLDPIPRSLVEDLLLWDESDHPYRQIRINLLANQMVSKYGREKVLEWYLNSAYFGNQIYGIYQAASVYFGKAPENLDLAESALLAAVAAFPSLNPYDSPNAAEENQKMVLNQMAADGLISSEVLNRAVQKQLIYADPESGANPETPAYVEYILNEAAEMIPQERLLRGGFNIISSLDNNLQHELECTTELMIYRVYGEDPDLQADCQASRLLPKYSGPVITNSDFLEIDLVLLDPLSGELLGMVGKSNLGDVQTIEEPKLPGTLLTPFIYLNSFTQGLEPASLTWDIPPSEGDFSSDDLHPGCIQNCNYLGPVNIREALANDYLSPAKQLWDSLGQNQLTNILSLFGFSIGTNTCRDCAVFSNSPSLDIFDLAQGYGVFVNQGFLRGRTKGSMGYEIQPKAILRIDDTSGQQLENEPDFVEKKVISEQLAYLINQVLSDEVVRSDSYGSDVFKIGRPSGVKVGYVPESESGWVIGYTPQVVTAVWAGGNDLTGETTQVDYLQITSSLWRAITQYFTRNLPVVNFEMPTGMLTMDVCYPSGLLPTENCPRVVRELFVEGNEPQSIDTLFQALEINRETGLLASVFTQSQLVEQRVYLVIPPEAITWAETCGISTPPTLYDLKSPSPREDFSFLSPENLSFVSGQVKLIGSIPEEGFKSARLQYGKGMNPRSWLQIGSEITSTGKNKNLGVWDTSELEDGVYALQLVMIQQGQQVDKVSLVVSVDNTPPDILLVDDFHGGVIPNNSGKDLLFEVESENNSEIQRVSFYLNGVLLTSRTDPPYIYPWPIKPGNYNLIIVAVDQADNQSEISVNFVVSED